MRTRSERVPNTQTRSELANAFRTHKRVRNGFFFTRAVCGVERCKSRIDTNTSVRVVAALFRPTDPAGKDGRRGGRQEEEEGKKEASERAKASDKGTCICAIYMHTHTHA